MKLSTFVLPILLLAPVCVHADPTPIPVPSQSTLDMRALFDLFADATRVSDPYPVMYNLTTHQDGFILAESSVPTPTVHETAALEPVTVNLVATSSTPSLGGIPFIPWTSITDIDVSGRANPLSPALLTIYVKGTFGFKEFGKGLAPKVIVNNGNTEVQIGFERQEDARKAQGLFLKLLSDLGDPIPTIH